MTKFLIMVLTSVMLVACGPKEPEQSVSKGVGNRFSLTELADVSEEDKKDLSKACDALKFKENLYLNQYVGKKVYFDFDSYQKNCLDTVKTQYQTAATLEMDNGEVVFNKLASSAFIFREVLLRSQGTLKKFCDIKEAKALTDRYVQDGDYVQVIYMAHRNNEIMLTIEKAYDIEDEGNYEVQSVDKIVLLNIKNKYRGAIKSREQISKGSCPQGGSLETGIRLKKIH